MRFIQFTFITLSLILFSCKDILEKQNDIPEIVRVEYPESYELANIILSLTDYGKEDKFEVRKDFEYYNKIQEYFKWVNDHALLDTVNYSRERWEEFLSFRTDSYAFEFNSKNQLTRAFDYFTNSGLQPFDDYLDLINDFIRKSNFRTFFKQNRFYYDTIIEKYRKTQYINQMLEFLTNEFGTQHPSENKYHIVLSALVYRMNCHRNLNSREAADFPTVPDYILVDSIQPTKEDIARSAHNLFTEMNHGYINPIIENYRIILSDNFDANLWDDESGYDQNGIFNEYMTWAVYDVFLQQYFPELATELGLNWSFQNESRGFKYAYVFTQQLLNLYKDKHERETLKDLYPKILKWTSEIQEDLTKPIIILPKDSLAVNFSNKTKISILFSEPMIKSKQLNAILQDENKTRESIQISMQKNNLRCSKEGMEVEFELNLDKKQKQYYLQFNWWGVKDAVISKKGILLKTGSFIKIVNR